MIPNHKKPYVRTKPPAEEPLRLLDRGLCFKTRGGWYCRMLERFDLPKEGRIYAAVHDVEEVYQAERARQASVFEATTKRLVYNVDGQPHRFVMHGRDGKALDANPNYDMVEYYPEVVYVREGQEPAQAGG
jgi:hypothetical protein